MNPKAKIAIERWWKSMMLSPAELKKEKGIMPAPTVYKAQLRRCKSDESTILSEGFRALWSSLPEEITDKSQYTMISWSAIAQVLVFVKVATENSIAFEAGKKETGDKSIVSELRFAQLQNAKTSEELIMRLRRILQQVKGKTSPVKIAIDIERWFVEQDNNQPHKASERLAVRWAMDYYKSASIKSK